MFDPDENSPEGTCENPPPPPPPPIAPNKPPPNDVYNPHEVG